MSYLLFLIVMTYVLLIETPETPSLSEYFLAMYVVAFGCELSRKVDIYSNLHIHLFQLYASESPNLRQKLRLIYTDVYNLVGFLAVVTFAIGFLLRLIPETRHSYGRVILATNSILWSVKLLDFMSVHHRLGPYITMAAKMVRLCITVTRLWYHIV